MHTQTSGGRCICKQIQGFRVLPLHCVPREPDEDRLSQGKIIRAVLFPAQLYTVQWLYITVSPGGTQAARPGPAPAALRVHWH
eukprot:764150-Hanusia_phi.AAC.6